jgi:hypothetical protein
LLIAGLVEPREFSGRRQISIGLRLSRRQSELWKPSLPLTNWPVSFETLMTASGVIFIFDPRVA